MCLCIYINAELLVFTLYIWGCMIFCLNTDFSSASVVTLPTLFLIVAGFILVSSMSLG